uniref:Uncharacterized protein n=1 Tax=Salmo trutta TaxID=8032 RepID=A0A673ZXH4_SALTR
MGTDSSTLPTTVSQSHSSPGFSTATHLYHVLFDVTFDPFSYSLRNYGGVYVGLPSDMTTVAGSQSKSTDKSKYDIYVYCSASV